MGARRDETWRAPRAVLCVAAVCGCVHGLRAGAEGVAYSGGGALAQATATGFAGFGSTHGDHEDTRSDGILMTATLASGADVRDATPSLGFTGGLEWLSVPDGDGGRVGYHVALEAGVRGRDARLRQLELLDQLRGGLVLRVGDRRRSSRSLWLLHIDATVGAAAGINGAADRVDVVGALSVTVGFMDVGRFHF